MKTIHLAAAGFALLAIAGCSGGNDDQLNAAETNEITQNLDALSNAAAGLAAEAEALENQANELDQEAEAADGTGAETPADENIAGM